MLMGHSDTAILRSYIRPIFEPRSIAVIGASSRPEAVGHAIFRNILFNNYQGVLYPVNIRATSICGVRAYKSVLDIPDPVDLAIVIIPAEVVPKALEECADKGIRGAVIISAGFKEVGGRGRDLEAEVVRIARERGICVVGPNCLGVINTDPKVSLNATFAATMPKAGPIAFISQSGALCTAVLDYARGRNIGFSKFASMGNKADINEVDLLRALRDDPQTKVILAYIEDLADGKSFVEVCRTVTGRGGSAAGKPVLAVKSGRTSEGAKAASSHTGSLAGSDEVFDGVFAQSGVLRADSVEELFNYAVAFSSMPLPRGDRVAIVTNAGGPGIMATDAVVRYGMKMAEPSPVTRLELRQLLPSAASVNNPIDVLGDAQADRYAAALAAIRDDPNVDAVQVILTPQAMTEIPQTAAAVVSAFKGTAKPVVTSFMGIVDVSAGIRILEENGIPHYTFPESAARALAAMRRYAEWVERPQTDIKTFPVDAERARGLIARMREQGRQYVPEAEAKQILECFGFRGPAAIHAKTIEECLAAGDRLGYPVAAKIVSPDIVHKFDVGGVVLGIRNRSALEDAYRGILESVRARAPGARIEGISVQEMVGGGVEVILGLKRDPLFGHLIMLGLGGIMVEVMRDVTFRVVPIRENSAYRMIKTIKAYKLLEGVRGRPRSDIGSLAEHILRLSQMCTELAADIEELDINPLIVLPEGKGCRMADARILLTPKGS
ncbi:MAG: acetate--CoA ligase family protein [Planctomycetota bacterium]|nr:acetate--CoA ligase family protein [Planctomycetota bacterium]